jgi:hypothetical protein
MSGDPWDELLGQAQDALRQQTEATATSARG